MAFTLIPSKGKKREFIVAIDLGGRTTKAVSLQRRGESFALLGYTITDAPTHDKALSSAALADHLKKVVEPLAAKTKQVTLAIGVGDSLFRNTELPQIPMPEMRLMLKLNAKNHLQQDLPDYVFDCHILAPKAPAPGEAIKPSAKLKVWVGGAKQQFIAELQSALRTAGLTPDQIAPAAIGPINAFELSHPDVFREGTVALVDLGFRNSTISIVDKGELKLSRVVGIGGDKITMGLAESLGVSYAEAEGIKLGMPREVEATLQPLLSPLGRELRASIDFFEHQQDKVVSQIYVSGAASQSEFMLQALQTELMVTCKGWLPTGLLQMSTPPQQTAAFEQAAPQLTVAIGAAMTLI